MRPNKKEKNLSKSQIFLQDDNIKHKIIKLIKNEEKFSEIENIFEVGVGSGEITRFLTKSFKDKKYLGVEIDKTLAKRVSKELNIEILNNDFLILKLKKLNNCLLFSAIPYHLTTKILKKFIENIYQLDLKILAFIIEERTFYRLLTDKKIVFYTFRQFFDLKKKIKINKQCFSPIPRVDSIFSIWYLKKNKFLNLSKEYLRVIKILNNKKNKNIINNLKISNDIKLIELINNKFLNRKFLTLSEEEKKQLIKIGIDYIKNKEHKD